MPNKQQRLITGPFPLFLAHWSQSVAHRGPISLVLLDGTSLQQKTFLLRTYHMLFKPSSCCNIQSQNTSRPARWWAAARRKVTQGLYGLHFFFSHVTSPFVNNISRTLEIIGTETLVRFFFCTASQTAVLYPPGLQGTMVDRLKPLEASRYLPVL